MNNTHDTWSLWFGAGVVLALGIVFGISLNEPGLIGGGIGAAISLCTIVVCLRTTDDDPRWWVRWLRRVFWTEW